VVAIDPDNEPMINAAGYPIAASVYAAHGSDTVVVINAATGVPRFFYRRFATWLKARGWTAVTYDYRGIGGSAPESLRGFRARMRDWALLDMTAVFDYVVAEFEPRRLFAVGHSFGGQTLGMVEPARCVTAAVGIAAQSGYWGLQPGSEKHRVRVAVSVLMPVLSRVFGYLPWRMFGAGEDLPKGVALEWARWCRNPNYLLDDETLPLDRYADFEAPILSYSIEDDVWGSAPAVDSMMRAYRNVTRQHLVPADFGLERIGHLGFFRETSAPIWEKTAEWFETQAQAAGRVLTSDPGRRRSRPR
jgi:predicted alpha/beta hydrolase